MIRAVPPDWQRRGRGHRGPHPEAPPRPGLAERLDNRKQLLVPSAAAPKTQNRDLVVILDQGPTEFCVEHVGVQLIRGCHVRQGIESPELASRRLLAAKVRKYERTFPQNMGCYPESMFAVLSRLGFDRESAWPWDVYDMDANITKPPPLILDREEFDQRASSPVDWADVSSVDDVIKLTDARHLCGWSGAVSNDFVDGNFDPAKPVGPMTTDIAGYHEMCVVWYDAENRRFLMTTSWGTYYANGGFIWATRELVESGINRTTMLHAEEFPTVREAA